MIRNFLKDRRGNYALATAIGIVPIMGALGLAVDYTDMSRQKAEVRNALELARVVGNRHTLFQAECERSTAVSRLNSGHAFRRICPMQLLLVVV